MHWLKSEELRLVNYDLEGGAKNSPNRFTGGSRTRQCASPQGGAANVARRKFHHKGLGEGT